MTIIYQCAQCTMWFTKRQSVRGHHSRLHPDVDFQLMTYYTEIKPRYSCGDGDAPPPAQPPPTTEAPTAPLKSSLTSPPIPKNKICLCENKSDRLDLDTTPKGPDTDTSVNSYQCWICRETIMAQLSIPSAPSVICCFECEQIINWDELPCWCGMLPGGSCNYCMSRGTT